MFMGSGGSCVEIMVNVQHTCLLERSPVCSSHRRQPKQCSYSPLLPLSVIITYRSMVSKLSNDVLKVCFILSSQTTCVTRMAIIKHFHYNDIVYKITCSRYMLQLYCEIHDSKIPINLSGNNKHAVTVYKVYGVRSVYKHNV